MSKRKNYQGGWAQPGDARKVHFFAADGRSPASAGCLSRQDLQRAARPGNHLRDLREEAPESFRENPATPFSNFQIFQNRGTAMKLYHAKVSPPSFYRHNQTDEERKAWKRTCQQAPCSLGNLEGVTIGNPGERNWEPSTWSNDVPVTCNEIGLGRPDRFGLGPGQGLSVHHHQPGPSWDNADPEAACDPCWNAWSWPRAGWLAGPKATSTNRRWCTASKAGTRTPARPSLVRISRASTVSCSRKTAARTNSSTPWTQGWRLLADLSSGSAPARLHPGAVRSCAADRTAWRGQEHRLNDHGQARWKALLASA